MVINFNIIYKRGTGSWFTVCSESIYRGCENLKYYFRKLLYLENLSKVIANHGP